MVYSAQMRVLLLLLSALCTWAQTPYVVLVSLDGFRYDYVERYHPQNLEAMAKAGAWTPQGMIPSFPSVTFPNHISLVTGMYPGHHGIVANTLWDPARQEEFSMSKASTDGTWYKAKPLWVIAEEQGVRSASMFWPSSDAEIDGIRPSAWFKYDGGVPNEERVAHVLDWLHQPAQQRPHFITLYFDDVDTAGHHYGPESAETKKAVERVDAMVGEVWRGIRESGLPVDLIVVGDHGMQLTTGAVNLSTFTDLSAVRVISGGLYALIYAPDHKIAEQVYAGLKGKSPQFDVYRRKETPPEWHYRDDPRIGDLVVIARQPVQLVTSAPKSEPEPGRHGFDPTQYKTMRTIFIAVGPNIRPKVRLRPFENVQVMPFLAKILGLRLPPDLDGDGKPLNRVYRKTRK